MKQKNLLFLMGILSLALVFGMTLVGCGGGDDDDDGGNTDPKSITITGLSGSGSIEIFLSNDDGKVAKGTGMISGGSVTVALMELDDQHNATATPWTGSGSYYLIFEIDSTTTYLYTEGKTLAELGGIASDADMNKLPKIAISAASTTVAFDQFNLMP